MADQSDEEVMPEWEIWTHVVWLQCPPLGQEYLYPDRKVITTSIGRQRAPTFQEACHAFFLFHGGRRLYERERLCWNGWPLFPSQAEALDAGNLSYSIRLA